MATMSRREAREEVFRLLFETEFQKELTPEEIYGLAREDRDFDDVPYIQSTYFGVLEKKEELDELITRHASGWRVDRIAPVSRSLLRLCIYEMRYVADVPVNVAINEAVELDKKFDEPKAKAFVNGILNAVKDELETAKVIETEGDKA